VTAVTKVATDLAEAVKAGEEFTEVLVQANLDGAREQAPNCRAVETGGK